MDPYAYVARVWHERTATWRARPKRISKNISEQQKMGADDGNRTRMTSLEGVLHRVVRAAELGGSLSGGDHD
jgi:hypothetical protein